MKIWMERVKEAQIEMRENVCLKRQASEPEREKGKRQRGRKNRERGLFYRSRLCLFL